MQYFIFLLLSIFSILGLSPNNIHSPNTPSEDKGELILHIDNIKLDTGIIWIGIYDSVENFMVKENAIVEGFKVNHRSIIDYTVADLAFGNYAIAIFHDENENGELDTNFLGIPNEPYGFSGTIRSKWRVPRYHEVQFDFEQSDQVVNIMLERW